MYDIFFMIVGVFLKCLTLTYEWIWGHKYISYVGYVP
jgi:hypothetical protein